MKRILITPGDPDGIGLEITIKALEKIGPQRGVEFYIWCHQSQGRQLSQIGRNKNIHFIISDELAPIWVEESAQLCLSKQADALVTGPLSKTLIRQAGLKDLGHSDILRRQANIKQTFMLFVGSKARILLLTDHIPLSQVSKSLTPKNIVHALKLFTDFNRRVPASSSRGKSAIAILGLNPHAGEGGLIGREEHEIFDKALKLVRRHNIRVQGPFPADGFFAAQMHLKQRHIVASYHDQGLIPFKMMHGFCEGVHVTLGLPFIRTCVDHGTAKQIYGRGLADPGSMIDAILLAIKMIENRDKRARRET